MPLACDLKLIFILLISELLGSHSFTGLGSSRISNFELFAKSGTKKKKVYDGTVALNRSAKFNYEIIDTYEAGIALLGMTHSKLFLL